MSRTEDLNSYCEDFAQNQHVWFYNVYIYFILYCFEYIKRTDKGQQMRQSSQHNQKKLTGSKFDC